MEGIFDILRGGEKIGKAEVRREGLYYRFRCCCDLTGEVMYRLIVICGGKTENLGIPVPEGDSFRLSTRTACMKIAMHIANSDELYRIIRAKRTLPVKRLMAETGANQKIFERYRKYIITAVVILRGEYEYIKDALVNSHIEH